jgi:hypothetical protein
MVNLEGQYDNNCEKEWPTGRPESSTIAEVLVRLSTATGICFLNFLNFELDFLILVQSSTPLYTKMSPNIYFFDGVPGLALRRKEGIAE